MQVIKSKANVVASALEKEGVDKVVAFDPMMILTIVQIIIGLFKLLQQCNMGFTEASDKLKKPNLFVRSAIARLVKKTCKARFKDKKEFLKFESDIKAAVIKIAPNITETEFQQMLAESRG